MSCKQDRALDAIADAYRNGTGVSELARISGRSRTAVYDILHARGVALKACTANGRKPRNDMVEYGGKRYTWSPKGYWRCTSYKDRHNLAWRIVEERTGEKLGKHSEVYFRDGNRNNLSFENLVCTTKSDRMKERLKDPDFYAYTLAVGTYARLNRAIKDELDPTRKAEASRRLWEARRKNTDADGTLLSGQKAWATRIARYGRSGCIDPVQSRKNMSQAHIGKPRKKAQCN